MLDRGRLGASSKHMLDITLETDPLENLFRSLLAEPSSLLDDQDSPHELSQLLEPQPDATDWYEVLGDVLDAEVVEEEDDEPLPEPEPDPPSRKHPHRPPKDVAEALLAGLI